MEDFPEFTTPVYQFHDCSQKRRCLLAGDIHGRFDLLKPRLEELNYDENEDQLILLGDLVDRGPFSHQALEWCRPEILRVLGNHEEMVLYAAWFPNDTHAYPRMMLRRNGGAWFDELTPNRMREFGQKLAEAPVMLEIVTPCEHKIGVVHASVPGGDWLRAVRLIEKDRVGTYRQNAMWDRSHIEELLSTEATHSITSIDHVFFGHTPVPEPLTHGNCTWIDTGAFRTNNLTVIDVDQWLSK